MIDTTKEVDVHINDLLIDDGHAIYEKLPVNNHDHTNGLLYNVINSITQ